MSEGDQTPPVGEEIHLPGESAIPLLTAVAITLIVIGTTIGWFLSIIGAVMLIAILYRWISDTRHDIAELPDEHGH